MTSKNKFLFIVVGFYKIATNGQRFGEVAVFENRRPVTAAE
jgi:hypothetical protein